MMKRNKLGRFEIGGSQESHWNWKGGVSSKVCKDCGISVSHGNHTGYCRKCSFKKGLLVNQWKNKPFIYKECNFCHKEFPVSKVNNTYCLRSRKFCSMKCSHSSREKNKEIQGKRSIHWKKIRNEILKRDNHSCMVCKEDGITMTENLVIHHMKPIFLGGTDDNGNLITMCKPCHIYVHKEGLYNNA